MLSVVTPPDPTAIGNSFVDVVGPQVISATTGVLPTIAPYAIGLAIIGGIWARFVGRRKNHVRV